LDREAKDELRSIIDGLSSEDRAHIRAIPADEVIRLHHGLGTRIRNRIRHNELKALFRWSRAQVPGGLGHLDHLAWPIVEEVWNQLQRESRLGD
jgi:hypothetical protein